MMKPSILCLLLALTALCAPCIPILAMPGDSSFSDVSPGARYTEAAEPTPTVTPPPSTPTPPPASAPDQEEACMPPLTIQVGGNSFTATLEDNETTRAFVAGLPMTVTMGELNGNEKFYYLPSRLPTNSHSPGTLHTGDLMLYGSDCLVLFYETFSNSYNYTRLGSLDDPSGLAAALGGSRVDVTFLASE